MKTLLILAVLLGVAGYFYFFRQGPEGPAGTPAADAAAAPAQAADPARSHGFDGVTALLHQDMNAIPTALDGPGHPPANALAIKYRVRPYLNVHREYVIITQACDLIIRADAQRTTFQQSYQAEQGRAGFDNALIHDSNPLTHDTSARSAQTAGHVPGNLLINTPPAAEGADAIHARIEGSWNSYRAQTAAQVQALLAPLAGKHL